MYNIFSDCVTSVSGVGKVSKGIVKTSENSHGYLSDFLKRI
jgi:hypothetical protein